MADFLTPEERSFRMSRIRPASTKPELKMRNNLWHLGFRYKVNEKQLPGKPDIVLPKYHTVIFIHGCFWHGHDGCKTSHIPQTNSDQWLAKITRNQERDQDVWRKLEAKGWSVIIVWECQLKKANLNETVERVAAEIVQNGEAYRAAQEERKKMREAYLMERKAKREREQALIEEIKK